MMETNFKGAEPKEFKYHAFISYRHCFPDRKWAKWLHRSLESWRTPQRLVRQQYPAKLGKIFRDEEELSVDATLSSSLEKALHESRFLIVICSPRCAESKWIGEEIAYFRKMGRHDRIFALLIEGEPEESFRPELLELRMEESHGGGGFLETSKTQVEPLAADVRLERTLRTTENPEPDQMSELKRFARLKMLAALLGCSFDDLRQREQERRIRAMRVWTGAAAAVIAIMTLLAVLAFFYANEASLQSARAVSNLSRIHYERGLEHLGEGRTRNAWTEFSQSAQLTPDDPVTAQMLYGLLAQRTPKLPVRPVWGGTSELSSASLYLPGKQVLLGYLGNGGADLIHLDDGPVYHLPGFVSNGHIRQDGKAMVISSSESGDVSVVSKLHFWSAVPASDSPPERSFPVLYPVRPVLVQGENHLFRTGMLTEQKAVYLGSRDGFAERDWSYHENHESPIEEILPNPVDPTVLTIDKDGTAILWDCEKREAIHSWLKTPEMEKIESGAFSPDGKYLALGFGGESDQLKLVDLQKMETRWEKTFDTVVAIQFSAKASRLAIGIKGNSDLAKVIDLESGEQISPGRSVGEPIKAVALSDDGERFAAIGAKGSAEVWDVQSGWELSRFRHGPRPRLIRFFDNDDRLVTIAEEGDVRQWTAREFRTSRSAVYFGEDVDQLRWNDDGTRFLTVSGSEPQNLRLFAYPTLEPIGDPIPMGCETEECANRKSNPILHGKGSIKECGFAGPDGRFVVCERDGAVGLFDPHANLIRTISAGKMGASDADLQTMFGDAAENPIKEMLEAMGTSSHRAMVHFNPRANLILACQFDLSNIAERYDDEELASDFQHDQDSIEKFISNLIAKIELYQADTLELLDTLEHRGGGFLFYPRTSDDGKFITAMPAATSGSKLFWRKTEGGNWEKTLRSSKTLQESWLSPGEESVEAGIGAKGFELFRPQEETAEPAFIETDHQIDDLWFSESGKYLAVAMNPSATTGKARVYHVETGKSIGLPIIQSDTINHIAFSPDERWIATASDNNEVNLFEIASGRPAYPTMTHSGDVNEVTFSPDGRALLSVSDDNHVYSRALPGPLQETPEWVMNLASGIGGERFTKDGSRENVAFSKVFEEVENFDEWSRGDSSWGEMAKYLGTAPHLRPSAPGGDSSITSFLMREAANTWEKGIDEYAVDRIRIARWLDPKVQTPPSLGPLASMLEGNFEEEPIIPTPQFDDMNLSLSWCPPGEFSMGTEALPEDNKEPLHRVLLTHGFWIGRYEITQSQWEEVMGTPAIDNASRTIQGEKSHLIFGSFRSPRIKDQKGEYLQEASRLSGLFGNGHPMIYVTWKEANAFCDKLNEMASDQNILPEGYRFRLPTEAQWEYAATCGGQDSNYTKAFEIQGKCHSKDLGKLAWYAGNSSQDYQGGGFNSSNWEEREFQGPWAGPRKVGQKPANQWGVHDLLGNVSEWCRDDYSSHYGSLQLRMQDVNPYHATPNKPNYTKVVKGGGYSSFAAVVRTGARFSASQESAYHAIGFRVVLSRN